MSQGWIKLHRILIDKPIWCCSTPEQKVIFITTLLLANHTGKQWEWKGMKFICKPGQFITSSSNLAIVAGVTRQNVRTALKKFKKYEFLTYESTKTGMLVTIVNWCKYQDDIRQGNQEDNQQLTNGQPTYNQLLTTNKNDKNDKNVENVKKYLYTPEFEKWYFEYPRPQAKKESFTNFEKVRKEKGLNFIWNCTRNYINYRNSIPEKDRGHPYSSNNFFGQKAYYLDFEYEKTSKVVNLNGISRYKADDYTG